MGGGGGGGMGGGGGGGGDYRQNASSDVTFHQHYGHAQPGSYAENKSPGYYKCREAAMPTKPVKFEDTFGSTGKGAEGAPTYSGASDKDLKKLGREPKLNDHMNDSGGQPEAPMPVQINQAATQDLSLPDDDFQAKKPPSKAGRMIGRTLSRTMNRAVGMGNAMGGGMLRMGGGGGGH